MKYLEIIKIIKNIPSKTGLPIIIIAYFSLLLEFIIEIGIGIPVSWDESIINGLNNIYKLLLLIVPTGLIFHIPTVVIPEIKNEFKIMPVVNNLLLDIKGVYDEILNAFDLSIAKENRIQRISNSTRAPTIEIDDEKISDVFSSVTDWNKKVSPLLEKLNYNGQTYCSHIMHMQTRLKNIINRLDTYRNYLNPEQIEILERLLKSRFFILVYNYHVLVTYQNIETFNSTLKQNIKSFLEDKYLIMKLLNNRYK
jgi:hypothetical protein